MLYKVPLILTPQPEGGFTVTSPVLPELVTEGDTADEALNNARDVLFLRAREGGALATCGGQPHLVLRMLAMQDRPAA